MSGGSWRRGLSLLRPYLGAFILLVGVVLTIIIVSMALNGTTPKWFVSLAMII